MILISMMKVNGTMISKKKLSVWSHKREKAEKTAVLVGIRTQESLHRWRTIAKERNSYYADKKYSKKIVDNVYNFILSTIGRLKTFG